MEEASVPCLKIPLEVDGESFATVDQDSLREIAQNVFSLLTTRRGSLLEDPDYGIEDAAFEDFPPLELTDEMLVQIEKYEPEARVRTIAELLELMTHLTIEVGAAA